jgi:threonine dehydrogenase-like Zn-dependent dehydrogenase
MKAIIWQGGKDMNPGEVPDPTPGPGQVLVRVHATAVCGSDMHLDDFGVGPPIVPGHEISGEIVRLGEGAGELAVGDRVALDPVQRCGQCWCCTNGIEHLCTNVRHLGVDGYNGGWAEQVAVDAVNAHRLPDGVDMVEACLAEPATVCYESFRRCGLREGDRVLIVGDGPFGYLHAQIARALGAGTIVVAGHYDRRLRRIAARTGAVGVNTHHEDLAERLHAEVGPPGVDVAVEATGATASPNLCIRALRPRGSAVIFSYVWRPEPLDMGRIHMNELNVLGACRSLRAYGAVLSLMAEKKIDTGDLADVRVPLDQYDRAADQLKNHKSEVFKAVLLPGE